MTTFICLFIFAGIAAFGLYVSRPFLRKFKKKFQVKIVSDFADTCNKVMRDRKQILFDEALLPLKNKQGKLEVLEIGAGPGSNFSFYPPQTSVTCLDPNEFFEDALRANVAKLEGNVTLDKLLLGKAEEMRDIEDCRFDACVCTYVLCSVDDPQIVLKQVLRVLKPGGRFLFLEHVAAADGSRIKFYQKLVCSVWRCVLECDLTRKTRQLVETAGFAETNVQSFFASEFNKVSSGLIFSAIVQLLSPHTSGYAVK